jgi:hypothetical protein
MKVLAVFLMMAASALATVSVCPAVGADTNGCELLVTVSSVDGSGNATGYTVTTSSPDQGPYDAIEDTLIGITNSSGSALTAIYLTTGAGGNIFGFDGDGACAGVNGASGTAYSPAPTAAECGDPTTQNPTGYGSEQDTLGDVLPVTFTVGGLCGVGDTDCGTVLINGATGLGDGMSTWFDLEGAISGSVLQSGGTPEPASVLLLGFGLAGLGFAARKLRVAR